MSAFDRVLDKAKATTRRIALPEATDLRVLRAAIEAKARNLVDPILIGDVDTINTVAREQDLSIDNLTIIDPQTAPGRDRYIELLVEKRQRRGMTHEKAAEAINQPLTFANLMVSAGDADGCVAGAITATNEVVRTAIRLVDKHPQAKQVTSFFIMLLKEHHPVDDVMVTADCALVIEPDIETLAAIAVDTGESARQLLGLTPEIAMLSFSTAGSAKHSAVSKVNKATQLAREQRPDWRIVGEVQLDAAVMPSILAKKAPEQSTDSPCNILIFPNLDAGNIGYKLLERFGGAQAIGPILQGLNRPVNDLSRGCSQDDIVNILAVTSAQCRDD
jgi:phosphate acetyltransferase